ncbi:MAG TPA: deoxyribose-phosphate aldolase [Candidatus Cryptobacteroides intestinipullorum]|nr:deoxyribose-phosphate aldolase [Candidatus Cryptobacteroides intestinipullorum]
MTDFLKKYGYCPDKIAIDHGLEIIVKNADNLLSPEVLKSCLSMIDLTSLKTDDTPESIERLVGKVNSFKESFPAYPLPASICVYPNFAGIVKAARTCDDVHVTVVAACFPSSQSFLEVKLKECELAVLDGADEVDIVLSLGAFLSGDYETAGNEIRAVREVIDRAAASQGRKVTLKVILETGLILKHELIADASFLAMESGADFIKTSTGKVTVNATPAAAYVMCQCIAKYYEKTGRRVGFKPAGGISTSLDAVCYYSIVSTLLGKEWLDKSLFRFGVSRLANTVLSDIEQRTVNYY